MDRTSTQTSIYKLVDPLFARLPLERAMGRLVVATASTVEDGLVDLVGRIIRSPVVVKRHDVAAALWLYIDELDRSHRHVQEDDTATGAFWHGIMHRREGDFANAHYWFRRAGRHPAMLEIDNPRGGGYDGHDFIDEVEMVSKQATDDNQSPNLVQLQRNEWKTLFDWCCRQ